MTLARCSLALTAVAFAAFGLWLLVAPQALGQVGVELPTPAARAEIRAFYGGLELGLAAFFAVAAARPAWFAPGLLAQALGLGGVVLGRLTGVVVDGATDPLLLALMGAEAAGCALGVVALVRLRGSSA
ncbi:MAG: DUF4345 domain-containing protein [Planctomycetes bacterium]|nr:DUF4345 domain-containing protein [Planctomycetota bacterium]